MTSGAPRVTVAIPTYNRAALVTRAVDSVLAQTYANVDVLVVDDGSTDDTMKVLQRYHSTGRVRVVAHSANRGTTAAKNTALDAVEAPFAAILDSDDELLTDAVSIVMAAFERLGDEFGMVFGNCIDAATGARTGTGLSASGEVTFRDAVTGRFGGEYWGVWRSAALGSRRFDETLPGGSESLVWHDMYRTTRVFYVDDVLRRYDRRSPDSVTAANSRSERLQRSVRMYEAYLQRFGDDVRRFDRRAYARHLQLTGLWHLLAGQRVTGVRRLAQSIAAGSLKQGIVSACLAMTPRVLLRRAVDARLRRRARETH